MTVHKAGPQYGMDVPLADTPTTWLDGPSISTLHAIAIFVGIPLLVILLIALLVYAPSWVSGPRYRPGQPWDAQPEWFGSPLAADATAPRLEAGADVGEASADPVDAGSSTRDPSTGGASATW